MSDWETRAIRSARRFGRIDLAEDPPRPGPATEAPARPRQDENRADWVTLREAHALTSIPLETMRKWARRGAITSYLEHGGTRSLRMVSLADVLARAETLGRSVSPIDSIVIDDSSSADALQTEQPATGRTPPADGSVRGTAPPQPRPVIRSDSQQHSDDPTGDALREETPATGGNIASADGKPDQGTPEGTMIVPIAAWDKMLIQLGNLHEAGQQLAEARERAARAEIVWWCRVRVMKSAPSLSVSSEQRGSLEKMARSTSLPHRGVVQAKALLWAADGVANEEIARRCGVDSDAVRRWRRRFSELGVAGVGVIAKGRGRRSWLPEGTVAEPRCTSSGSAWPRYARPTPPLRLRRPSHKPSRPSLPAGF